MRIGLLAVCSAALACTSGEPSGGDSAAAETSDPLSAEALAAGTARLTDLGPRLVGTPAEEAALAEVLEMFAEAGLQEVTAEPFTYDAWQPGPAAITVGGVRWEAEPLSPSPATAGLEAVLRSSEAEELEGTVGIWSSEEGSRAEQFLAANAADVAAMIRVTEDLDHDGGPLVEVGHTFESVRLPALAVDRETGAALREHLGETVTVDLESTTLVDFTSSNVVGRIEGRTPSVVYVTAHYDSWHPSESAIDNALGVAVQVALAARLAEGPSPKRTVVFLATSAEEQGLQGAVAWARDHAEEIEASGDAVLNLDIPWAAEGTFWCNSTDAGTVELALEAAAELGLEARDGGSPSASSDHVPFQGRGLEATWLTRWPDRHYHTTQDLHGHLDWDEAALAAEVNWRVLAEVAGVD